MINLKKLPAKEVFKGVRIIEEDRGSGSIFGGENEKCFRVPYLAC